MSSSWRAEYLTALEARDSKEKVNYEIFAAYTKLADRTTSLENHNNHNPKRPIETPSTTAPPNAGDNKAKTTSTETALLLTRLRRDLADAQRSKAELDGRLKTCTEELERIKRISQTNSRRVEELSVERATLIRAVKDRDEELKEKAKLFQNVQDEIISLNLQLNLAERRAQDLKTENKELVDRWMARMGREADAMNDASRFS